MPARSGIRVAAIAVFALQLSLNFAELPFYPELRPDIQKYQDAQRCPDMREDFYLVYRNYLYDPYYGGTSRCVKFHRIEAYTDVHTSTKVSWHSPGYGRRYMHGHQILTSTPGYMIRNEHTLISHHGYGCSLWRAASLVSQNRTDHCDFIFDVVCGNSPKYQIYDPACEEAPECYPDVGKWHLMHRNYYSDPNFGGAAKCVTFERYGSYENFSTPAVYSFGKQGST
ncbi:hypothetical protein HPB50_000437 [Hyalomma asiaticum]|uniref:Uncharacterized protein n=1 Tax=Hyalomma asiaticum TaxID=266040 RepID=A0ACB7RNF5_HYAAI|nr:hypothetical protein HPB50_000437 [Hyalomma asiaticum]